MNLHSFRGDKHFSLQWQAMRSNEVERRRQARAWNFFTVSRASWKHLQHVIPVRGMARDRAYHDEKHSCFAIVMLVFEEILGRRMLCLSPILMKTVIKQRKRGAILCREDAVGAMIWSTLKWRILGCIHIMCRLRRFLIGFRIVFLSSSILIPWE